MSKRINSKMTSATINDDGSIDFAPMYDDAFRSLSNRERALKQLQITTGTGQVPAPRISDLNARIEAMKVTA